VKLSRRVLFNVIFFAVMFGLMTTWAVQQVVSVDELDQPYEISARFANAFGIVPNAEVTYLGVGFGTVTTVDRVPGGVRIGMKIERERRIPADATAAIGRKSAVGEPYIDFEPAAGTAPEDAGAPFLKAGDVVPQERTSVPLEFSELLRSASGVVASIPPDRLHTLVHELSLGLDGRSKDLRDLATASDDLAATFAAKTETLDRLAVNNTRLTHVVTEHRGDLASSLRSLQEVSDTLKRSRGDTSLLLDRGSVLLTETADLVAAEKGNLDCDLKVLELLLDETTTPRRLDELRALLEIGPKAYAQFYDTIDVEPDGPWIRVGNISNQENPPAQYVPPKSLPPVQQVQACASALRAVNQLDAASSGDYRPRTAAPPAPGATSLPATGAMGAASGGGVLLAGWVVTAWVRRRQGRRLASAA
jgi:phospholipid/cholesterol/gamma-HCH transport system substrate-binding protein